MPQTRITLPFGDGDYEFYLGLRQLREVEVACKGSLGEILARVLAGFYTAGVELAFGNPLEAKYSIDDLIAVVHQGLIGGGKGRVHGEEVRVDHTRAKQLVDNYALAEGVTLQELWRLAGRVAGIASEGYEPNDAKAGAPKKKVR
jgi:hypothetical protein